MSFFLLGHLAGGITAERHEKRCPLAKCRTVVSMCLLLAAAITHASEAVEADVTYDAGVYTLNVHARITAPLTKVRDMLTAYDHLERVNPAVKESWVIYAFSPLHHRVYTRIDACVAFYCKQLLQVWDVEENPDGDIMATIVPEASNFKSGQASWILREVNGKTGLHFTTVLEPSFWVPPLIGPWLIRYTLRREALESIKNLECQHIQIEQQLVEDTRS